MKYFLYIQSMYENIINKMTIKEVQDDENKIWPQILAVLTALITMFNSGLHFGWPSASIPKILSDEFPLNVSVEDASYIAIIGPAGDILGSIVYSYIVDIIGRKNTILLIGIPQIISMVMIFFSNHTIVLLYIARFIGGMAEGACFTVIPLYICEVAEPKIRGFLGSFFSFVLILGIFSVDVLGSQLSIQTCAWMFCIPPVVFLLIFPAMPESPYYLLMKSRKEDAAKSLKFLRWKKNVDKELEQLNKDVNRQMSEPGAFKDLLSEKANRKACVVMIGIRLIQQFSGVGAFTVYMQTLFEQSTDFLPKHMASNLIFGLQLIINFVATLVVDKFGRKPLLIASCAGCFLVLILQGTYYFIQDYTSIDLSMYSYLLIFSIFAYMTSFGVGLGSVTNLILGELFSSNIKAKASCLMNIVFAGGLIVSTKFLQYTSYKFSLAVPFYVFALCQLCGLIFCIAYVPETAGKTLEEIQQDLKKNGKFVKNEK